VCFLSPETKGEENEMRTTKEGSTKTRIEMSVTNSTTIERVLLREEPMERDIFFLYRKEAGSRYGAV
jgi:hypothetical protein